MEAQCPICFFLFPVHQIEEHADSCSSFFTVESEDDPLPNSPSRKVQEETRLLNVDSGSHTSCSKSLLKEQIKSWSANSSPDLTHINVRRRNLWEDFKNARRKKINSVSNLKIVFVGEPSIDDGGPKREFFLW